MDSINVSDFDLEKTLKCGQLFRYDKKENSYFISHRDRLFKIRQEKSQLLFSGVDREFISDFFRLNDDYEAIIKSISNDEFMREVIDHNYGMRLMRQDPWEYQLHVFRKKHNSQNQAESFDDFGDIW